MIVKLLWHTPEPEYQIALAMRRCYSSEPIDVIEKELKEKGPEYIKYLIDRAKKDGSLDVLEHSVWMFEIEGVSRALTHQLVRHRIASYDQESQRFAPSPKEYIIPESIVKAGLEDYFRKHMDSIWEAYLWMINEKKIPKQDARYILPNATETKLVMTLNTRSLMHFLYMRTAKGAQKEIRDLANMLWEIVKPLAPNVFSEVIQC